MSKFSIKQILLTNNNWWRFYNKHKDNLRPAIVTCIIKLLSCKNKIRGYREFHCSNPNCQHKKIIPFTCKSKACSSCGKKATEVWIHKQNQILPNTSWQHITLTMPCELWDFFWLNRWLFNSAASTAANCLLNFAKKRGILLGIFIAIHTFGRDLKRNVHFHLSTTAGGLTDHLSKWKFLSFHQISLMKIWRYQIITLFRNAYKQNKLIIPPSLQKQLNSSFTFYHFLDFLYKKIWIIDCPKPTNNFKQIVRYLGSYFKRPPIAQSKLKHFDGNEVSFKYLDHLSKSYRNFSLSSEQFIARFVQHIPDTNFRMLRYYGFLANRVRNKLLPIVYQLLGQNNHQPYNVPSFSQLIQQNFNFNPLTCILCLQPLVLKSIRFGLNIKQLFTYHRELALLKNV